jgi:hypothetical protein
MAEAEKSKKNKKIKRLSLAEIEAKLQEVQQQMGGLQSKYAQHLLARKAVLTGQK